MNKTELKTKWGKYTDTDKLVEDIASLLHECRIKYTTEGICAMLDTYFVRKEPLINLLAKSENYLGDMRIMIPAEIERRIPGYQIRVFMDNFRNNRNVSKTILQTKDSSGKTILDYLKVGTKSINVSEITDIEKDVSFLRNFTTHGHTVSSNSTYETFRDVIDRFYYIYESQLSLENVNAIMGYVPDEKLAVGLKTSRAFNRICCKFGIDKMAEYNKLFAQYSDMVSPGLQQLDYIISVNPYDYLTMSFGHSWTSCQSIKTGGWKGGTLSYMLDESSIITYMVKKAEDPQHADKIYRNMIHYHNNKFIQGRIYPQDSDGATNLYTAFRELICKEMSAILELKENRWIVAEGRNECRASTSTKGSHYRDYLSFDSCNVFIPAEREHCRETIVTIGSEGICPYCGEEISESHLISHNYH